MRARDWKTNEGGLNFKLSERLISRIKLNRYINSKVTETFLRYIWLIVAEMLNLSFIKKGIEYHLVILILTKVFMLHYNIRC